MRITSPERFAAVGVASTLLFAGCSNPSSELTSAEPKVTVTEYALPSEASSPKETATPQIPDTKLGTPTPSPSPTEKPKTNKKKANSLGLVILDNCDSNDIQYYDYDDHSDWDTANNNPIYRVETNIGKLAYGKDYDPSAPHQSVCKQTSVSVAKVLNELVMTITKESKYTNMADSNTSKNQKPKSFVAVTNKDSLDINYGSDTATINCETEKKRLGDESICSDGVLTPQEIAEEMIAPSVLRDIVKSKVLKRLTNKKSFDYNATLAVIRFDIPESK